MKTILTTLSSLLISLIVKSQELPTGGSDDNYGWNKRISFISGAGSSFVFTGLYADPVINQTNNFVSIEQASIVKPNLSVGIIFTPNVDNIKREIKFIEGDKEIVKYIYEYYPKGISYALFINPISFSDLSNIGVNNTVDLGLGIGRRSGNFAFLFTCEFFSVRQPRDYFIEQFKDNNQAYVVNGEVQSSIDINDNSIFKNTVEVSAGVKICFTFDVVKSFYSNSQKISASDIK